MVSIFFSLTAMLHLAKERPGPELVILPTDADKIQVICPLRSNFLYHFNASDGPYLPPEGPYLLLEGRTLQTEIQLYPHPHKCLSNTEANHHYQCIAEKPMWPVFLKLKNRKYIWWVISPCTLHSLHIIAPKLLGLNYCWREIFTQFSLFKIPLTMIANYRNKLNCTAILYFILAKAFYYC